MAPNPIGRRRARQSSGVGSDAQVAAAADLAARRRGAVAERPGARRGRRPGGPPRGRRRPARAGRRWTGPSASGSGASRSTSQPRGAVQPLAVHLAQVVGVRLGVRRQRAEHGGRVGVDVGQRGDRGPRRRRCASNGGQDSRSRRYRLGGTATTRLADVSHPVPPTRAATAPPAAAATPGPARPRDARPGAAAGPAGARRRARRARARRRRSTRSWWPSSRSSRAAGTPSSAWWSSPSRRPRWCPTTGTPTPCRWPRWCAAPAAQPTRLVLFRRPIELRAETRSDLDRDGADRARRAGLRAARAAARGGRPPLRRRRRLRPLSAGPAARTAARPAAAAPSAAPTRCPRRRSVTAPCTVPASRPSVDGADHDVGRTLASATRSAVAVASMARTRAVDPRALRVVRRDGGLRGDRRRRSAARVASAPRTTGAAAGPTSGATGVA